MSTGSTSPQDFTFSHCAVLRRRPARRRRRTASPGRRGTSATSACPLAAFSRKSATWWTKRVLVADLQARHPPVLHVRLVAVGDVDRPPAADDGLVAVVEVAEPMQVVQVPGDRGVLAVDLERVQGLVAAGVAGGLEVAQRAVAEAAEERAGVVDARPARPCRCRRSLRSLMNVSVMAVTDVIGPLCHRAVSMQWASRSPVTPEPAALTSSRHVPMPPCGSSAEIVQSCRKFAR